MTTHLFSRETPSFAGSLYILYLPTIPAIIIYITYELSVENLVISSILPKSQFLTSLKILKILIHPANIQYTTPNILLSKIKQKLTRNG